MILFDTSIWVAHLRSPDGHPGLISALQDGLAASHPFVQGELLLAGAAVEILLGGVEMLAVEPHGEVREWVEGLPKPVRGVGWVDVHLAYSALVNGTDLATADRNLARFWTSLHPEP